MKKALFYFMVFATLVACDQLPDDEPIVVPPTPENSIAIEVDEERLTAYQVIYSI